MWTNFELHPWPIALAATATMAGIAVYPMLLTAHATLLKQLGFPATPASSGRRWFRCTPRCNPSSPTLLHWIRLLVQGFLAEPAFLICACIAEWDNVAKMTSCVKDSSCFA